MNPLSNFFEDFSQTLPGNIQLSFGSPTEGGLENLEALLCEIGSTQLGRLSFSSLYYYGLS